MKLWKFRTKNFLVEYKTEDERFDGSYMEADLVRECREKIKSGEWKCFTAMVVVTHRPTKTELDAQYLGQCIYADRAEFIDHRGMNGKGYGSYFSQMVREACSEARKSLKRERAKADEQSQALNKGLCR